MPAARALSTLASATNAACYKASRAEANHSVGPTCGGGNCPPAEEAGGKLRSARPPHPRDRVKHSEPLRNQRRRRETESKESCSTLRIDPKSDSEAPARHAGRIRPNPVQPSAAKPPSAA